MEISAKLIDQIGKPEPLSRWAFAVKFVGDTVPESPKLIGVKKRFDLLP
jgi:hypothetical protein